MVRYRCRQCNYVFSPKIKGKVPNRCPYCSEFNTLIEERSILERMDIKTHQEE